ncbi:uncharacterized protein RJT21DRAFT_56336 [Scheffersomyces amazonensis]|uniref:uncharacterized protein n=1 Tax=Scheffersomyces amazonensis TaxID=1078765 RepID=UPI00315DF16D
MLSIAGLYAILGIPVRLIILILKYPLVGGIGRKFKRNLTQSLKLLVCRSGLLVPIRDCRYICIYSNNFLLNRIIKLVNHSLIKSLPHFGEKYDQNSFWIVKQPDRKPDDPVIIYLHGGGYYFETMPSQIQSLITIYKLLDPELQSRVSILHLGYKLACRGFSIPCQLLQLHETYKKLANEDGATNISFIGDSAGGNLAIVYPQYLKLIANKQDSDIQLPYPKKLVLVSPWTKVRPEAQQYVPGNSYYDNNPRDMIRYEAFSDLDRSKCIVGTSNVHSLLVSPGNTTLQRQDWISVPTFSSPDSDVLVIVGEDEVFRDDVLLWGKYALDVPLYDDHKYGDSEGKNLDKMWYIRTNDGKRAGVRFYVEPWGVHDSTFFFETHLIKRVNNLKLNDVDTQEFYGISRIAQFLNDTLK